jgi:Tfp pilus assembly protein PilO
MEANKNKKEQNKKEVSQLKELKILINQFFTPVVLMVILVVLLAGYLLVVKAEYRRLADRQQDLSNLERLVGDLRDKQRILEQYRARAFQFSASEEKLLNLALPNEFDFSSLVMQLKGLADKYNFLINDIKVSDTDGQLAAAQANGNKTPLKKVDIEIVVSADSYDKFKSFLAGLESSIMFFDIVAVDFASDRPVYTLDLITYYYATL